MRTSSATSGSTTDRLHGIAIALRDCPDLGRLEYAWPRVARALEFVADRVGLVRRRGGSVPGLGASLDWLESVADQSAAFADPGAGPIREELAVLVRRCRDDRRVV